MLPRTAKKASSYWPIGKPVGQFAMITGQNNEAGDLKYVNTDDRGFAKDAGFY